MGRKGEDLFCCCCFFLDPCNLQEGSIVLQFETVISQSRQRSLLPKERIKTTQEICQRTLHSSKRQWFVSLTLVEDVIDRRRRGTERHVLTDVVSHRSSKGILRRIHQSIFSQGRFYITVFVVRSCDMSHLKVVHGLLS